MKSATIFLLVLVCSAAFAVPSGPKKFTGKELVLKATDFAFKTVQDFKVNQRGTHDDGGDYLQPIVDVILKADWRVIIEQSLESGDKICDIVYDTFNQVETRIGADAAKYMRDNFETIIGKEMASLFKTVSEGAHSIVRNWENSWFPWVIPYAITAYFVDVIFHLEYYISTAFESAISRDFPEDYETFRGIFKGFDNKMIDETLRYLEIIGDAIINPPA